MSEQTQPTGQKTLQRVLVLAWVAEQEAWQTELTAQVREVLGEDTNPARILVVDDYLYEGTTRLLALGLLKAVFPQAKARYIAGSASDWGEDMAECWLSKHHPEVYAVMKADARGKFLRTNVMTCFRHLHRIAPGTEDVDPESLAWCPITVEHESVQALTQFLPAEEWLTMPAAMYEAVESYVRQRAREAGSPIPPPKSVAEASSISYSHAIVKWLTMEQFILLHTWQTGRVTREDVATICGISLSEAKRTLRELVRQGHLVRHGKRKSRWYDLPIKAGVLIYYSSPLADLESVIDPALLRRVEDVKTPFEVEYACSSRERADAPVLVPVPDGNGVSIPGRLFLMHPWYSAGSVHVDIENWAEARMGHQDGACDASDTPEDVDPIWVEFRRDPDLVQSTLLDEDSKRLLTSRSREFFAQTGISYVLYTRLKHNLKFVLRDDLPVWEKAQRLAQLAVDSVTPETFRENRDGIRYLADAIHHGICTPLTEPYQQAILRLADDAPDLEAARRRIARQKGIAVL